MSFKEIADRSSTCRQSIRAALEICHSWEKKRSEASKESDASRKAFAGVSCWADAPLLHRKCLVRLAGLDQFVVHKSDKELSESEKALLRATAKNLIASISEIERFL